MLRALLSPRLILAGVVFGILLLVGILAVLWFTRPAYIPEGTTSAVIQLTPAPHATATPLPPRVTPSLTPEPEASSLKIGGRARVAGTGGDGLRVRSEPNLQADILLVASEGEIFIIQDGPTENDGYTWYLLIDPDDSTRQGWAVADFLRPER